MPNASATGSLIVAAPSGSYGTGTPQRPLTIVSGQAVTTEGLQIIAAPSGSHSLRLFEASLDLSMVKDGLERTTGVLSLFGLFHLAVGTYNNLSSYDQMAPDILATIANAGSVFITGSSQLFQAFNFANKQVFRWSQGILLGPGKGLYIFTTPAMVIGAANMYYRAMYDVP